MRFSTHPWRSVEVLAGGHQGAPLPYPKPQAHLPSAQERRECSRTTLQPSQSAGPAFGGVPIPRYLAQLYWWAYVHPKAVHFFDRKWLVNLILLGNYRRLCNASLAEFGETLGGQTLQIGCVYGNLTLRLRQRLSPNARLDVVDVLPIQLDNLAKKLSPDERVQLWHGDASSLSFSNASYDYVLLFFLLHEQPRPVRRATMSEAMRIVKPGGRVIIVDYHRPRRWHPMLPLVRFVLRKLKPYAVDLWMNDVESFLLQTHEPATLHKTTFFGDLYQKVVLTRQHRR
ncbi:MAG TPA: rhodoquinone biosynthesis methyltransferase RquA [Burkholderiaceae bacterium]|jgi:ubiquinone/menaquinone biosynthesis C-methylase UbiE|nr:rhodoquinone biosynthesis methyltransferase RquA [Burkholderiaceae bacterium]